MRRNIIGAQLGHSQLSDGTVMVIEHARLGDRRKTSKQEWNYNPENRIPPNVIFTPNTGCTNHNGTFTEGCAWCARFAAITGKFAKI